MGTDLIVSAKKLWGRTSSIRETMGTDLIDFGADGAQNYGDGPHRFENYGDGPHRIAVPVIALGYSLWSWATERQLAAFFIEHQARVDGTYGLGLTLLATSLTVVGVLLLLAVLGVGLARLRRRERVPSELLDHVRRFRRPRAAAAAAAFVVSGGSLAALLFAPDPTHAALGRLVALPLLLVPACPISLAFLVEVLLPLRYADGEVNGLLIETRGFDPPVDVHTARVGHRKVVVPRYVFEGLVEGERVGVVTTGGALERLITLTRPSSEVGPYR